MFKFDFHQNEEDLNDFEGIRGIDSTEDRYTDDGFIPCNDYTTRYYNDFEEIHPKSNQTNRPIISSVIYGRMTFGNNYEIKYVRIDAQEELLLDIKGDHTDLIPGVYEGGGKIWECTQDLGDYLAKSTNDEDSLGKLVSNKHVLDLGCGAGILGIFALKAGAFVHFSDYNASILSTLTIENVVLNFQENKSEILQRCKLKNDGVALVAAKTYYFGVGGGCRDFEKLIKTDGNMQSEIVLVVSENVQREILKVTFRNKQDI